MDTYVKNMSSPEPGYFIFLLDQSGSMEDSFGGENQLGKGRKKCEMVTNLLNSLLQQLVEVNKDPQDLIIKNRADISVIAYNGAGVASALPVELSGKDWVSLQELNDAPIRIDAKAKKEMDDTGNIIEVPIYIPVWIEPVATGGTPMSAALRRARDLADKWVQAHPDNYPPVVVNITDGMVTDIQDPQNPVEFFDAANELRQVETTDGHVLLYNCHITDKNLAPIEYPTGEEDVPADPEHARWLFSTTSVVPDTARDQLKSQASLDLLAGARGFIFNGDAGSVKNMFVFATVATGFDPSR